MPKRASNIVIATDNLIKVWIGPSRRTDAAPTTTSATARILQDDDDLGEVANSSINLTQEAGNPQLFWGEFDDSVPLVAGQKYLVEVIVTADGKKTTVRKPFTAAYEDG